MWWPFQWILIYLVGGLTFLPLIVILVIGYVARYGSVPIDKGDPIKLTKSQLQTATSDTEAHFENKETARGRERQDSSVVPSVSGWLNVRRQFLPHGSAQNGIRVTNGSSTTATASVPALIASPVEELSEDEALIKSSATTDDNNSLFDAPDTSTSISPASTSTSKPTYTTRLAWTYRTIIPGSKPAPPSKESFFCLLKSSILFMYSDETQSDCVAAIDIHDYVVDIEDDDGKFRGKDGEMFSKRHAIVLKVKNQGASKGLSILTRAMGADGSRNEDLINRPIYLFSKSNSRMEDWYLALLAVSSQCLTSDTVFSTEDMQNLVDTIDIEPDPIPMRWFNAALGRVFFGYYRTEAFEQFIMQKMMKKLSKVQRPTFLGPIVVREVNVGKCPPFFSKPMLKDLSPLGQAAFEVHVSHRSPDVRFTVATTATIPTGFKPYVVDLVLAVVLKSFEGNLVVQIKGPPSNRIWYAFTQMPKMDIDVIPVVSERKIQIGMVLKAIEKQLRDVVAESVVLPNMDDLAFFDTSSLPVRGGIFDTAAKIKRNERGEKEVPDANGVSSQKDIGSVMSENHDVFNKKHEKRKSQTLDPGIGISSSLSLEANIPSNFSEVAIDRPEAASVSVSSNSSMASRKTAALAATKKWFANSSSKPPSIASQTVNGEFGLPKMQSETSSGSPSQGKGNECRDRHSSIDPDIPPDRFSINSNQVTNLKEHKDRSANTSVSSLEPPFISDTILKPTDTSPSTSTSSIPTTTSNTTTTTTTSAALLISNLKTRDREALRAQVDSAREQVKKWGVNWAARRKAGRTSVGTKEEVGNKHALYRPPEEEKDLKDEPLSAVNKKTYNHSPQLHGDGQVRSNFQKRLHATTQTDALSTSKPIPVQVHQRSSSRTNIIPLQSKTSSASSISPSKWTPEGGKPTTSLMTDSALPLHTTVDAERSYMTTTNIPSAQLESSHTRRHSNTSPVYTQPTMGKSMVVPRVPKRPGQVTGIGSDDLLLPETKTRHSVEDAASNVEPSVDLDKGEKPQPFVLSHKLSPVSTRKLSPSQFSYAPSPAETSSSGSIKSYPDKATPILTHASGDRISNTTKRSNLLDGLIDIVSSERSSRRNSLMIQSVSPVENTLLTIPSAEVGGSGAENALRIVAARHGEAECVKGELEREVDREGEEKDKEQDQNMVVQEEGEN
ncbi:hypothetical protein L204_100142 [Cryptococcus depauperatus]